MYAKSSLGDQKTVAQILDKIIQKVEAIIADHDEECVKQVFRVLCHFYLPPCGNTTHPAPPSSICQEECQMVQDNCQKTWTSVLLAFEADIYLVNIDCSDTSKLLFPVPHCCSGAGIGINLSHTTYFSVLTHRYRYAHTFLARLLQIAHAPYFSVCLSHTDICPHTTTCTLLVSHELFAFQLHLHL